MPIFIPLENTHEIDRIEISSFDLQELKSIVMMALDHNPSDPKFAESMQQAVPLLGQSTIDTWLVYLQTITTDGETPESINFVIEDWIDTWRIADFIDIVWPIARIEYDTDSTSVEETKEYDDEKQSL